MRQTKVYKQGTVGHTSNLDLRSMILASIDKTINTSLIQPFVTQTGILEGSVFPK